MDKETKNTVGPSCFEFPADDPELLPFLRKLDKDGPFKRAVLQVGQVDTSAVNLYVDMLKSWFMGKSRPVERICLKHVEGLITPSWLFEK